MTRIRRLKYLRGFSGVEPWALKHQQALAATERHFKIRIARDSSGLTPEQWEYFQALVEKHVVPLINSPTRFA